VKRLGIRDKLIEQRMLAHYWVWLCFTTEHVSESRRFRDLRHALEALHGRAL
jgi:hypothetical protein